MERVPAKGEGSRRKKRRRELNIRRKHLDRGVWTTRFNSRYTLVFLVVGFSFFIWCHRVTRVAPAPVWHTLHASPDLTVHRAVPSLDLSEYLVWSPSCVIKKLDPFHKSLRTIWKPSRPINCSNVPPLTYVQYPSQSEDVNSNKYTIRVNKTLLSSYVDLGWKLKCCYSLVKRGIVRPGQSIYKTDYIFKVTPSICFEYEVVLKPEEEFVLVDCKTYQKHSNLSKLVYKNMHAMAPMKQKVRKRVRKRKSPNDDDKLNVLIVVYDSIAQNNLLRTMPKTVQVLKGKGFVNMNGYHKIGKFTFPNALALLTGLNEPQARATCWLKFEGEMDNCSFIWKDYHKLGYVTALIEDTATYNSFNHQAGFIKQPADYYLRPYILAAFKNLFVKTLYDSPVCFGPTSTTDHTFNYLISFIKTFRDYLYFSLVWMTNFSHDDINLPKTMDNRTVELLEDLWSLNVHNNTLFIFMSDHGMPYGRIRYTDQGWYEEQLPYVYFSLPEWFKMKYPEKVQTLFGNRNKLISPYDLYVTLKDFSNFALRLTKNVSPGCPSCKSLISEEIGDRKCEDAGVPEEYCICTQYEEISTNNTMVKNAVLFVLNEMNKSLKDSLDPLLCAKLSLHKIVKAKFKFEREVKKIRDYLVTFETLPGGGLFQNVVRYYKKKKQFSIIGNLQRINSYEGQSNCINDHELKLYCFCLKQYFHCFIFFDSRTGESYSRGFQINIV